MAADFFAIDNRTLLAVDMIGGRILGVGTYAEIREYYDGWFSDTAILWCGKLLADDECFWKLDHEVLRQVADAMGIPRAATLERDKLVLACTLAVRESESFPALALSWCVKYDPNAKKWHEYDLPDNNKGSKLKTPKPHKPGITDKMAKKTTAAAPTVQPTTTGNSPAARAAAAKAASEAPPAKTTKTRKAAAAPAPAPTDVPGKPTVASRAAAAAAPAAGTLKERTEAACKSIVGRGKTLYSADVFAALPDDMKMQVGGYANKWAAANGVTYVKGDNPKPKAAKPAATPAPEPAPSKPAKAAKASAIPPAAPGTSPAARAAAKASSKAAGVVGAAMDDMNKPAARQAKTAKPAAAPAPVASLKGQVAKVCKEVRGRAAKLYKGDVVARFPDANPSSLTRLVKEWATANGAELVQGTKPVKGVPTAAPAPAPKAAKPAKATNGHANGASEPRSSAATGEPRPGSVTALVWNTADKLAASGAKLKTPKAINASAVVAALASHNLNEPTVRVQVSRWAKYRNYQLAPAR